MSYKLLDHATDAIIEVKAKDLDEAFTVAGQAVADITDRYQNQFQRNKNGILPFQEMI